MLSTVELTKELLYICNEVQISDAEDMISVEEKRTFSWMKSIKSYMELLKDLSPDTLEFLYNSRYFSDESTSQMLRDTLNEFTDGMETEYNRNVPARDFEYERVRLGEDSEEFKRLLRLRDIAESPDMNFHENPFLLPKMIDILEHGENCIRLKWVSEERYRKLSEFINRYDLSEDDIDYMISYIKKCKRRGSSA